MKTRIYIIILFCLATMTALAQTFSAKPIENTPIQSQQIMTTGTNYNGTVYEPFTTSAPSEYTASSSTESYNPAHAAGRRKGFDTPGDLNQGDEYPIGDAMLPLLLMAVVFCGVIYLRRKRAAQKS
ncbi:MAG: hypothetical protein IJQ20_06930 [Paludibacteraceae bacterium]|nr:hypothetical protein [Paludibacteraceae bacterium]